MERRLQTKLCTRGTEEMLGDIRIGARLNEKNIKLKDRTVSTNVFIYKRQVWRNVISAALKKLVLEANPSILSTIFMLKSGETVLKEFWGRQGAQEEINETVQSVVLNIIYSQKCKSGLFLWRPVPRDCSLCSKQELFFPRTPSWPPVDFNMALVGSHSLNLHTWDVMICGAGDVLFGCWPCTAGIFQYLWKRWGKSYSAWGWGNGFSHL